MNDTSESGELHPFDAPLHFTVENLRVSGHLNLDGEEGKQEPPFEFAAAGLAALDTDRYLGIKHGSARCSHFDLRIVSENYSDIVSRNREIRERFGSPEFELMATDTLATNAAIYHVEREVSEVGVLWGEMWSLQVTLPLEAFRGLVESIRSDNANVMNLSLRLQNLLTEEDPKEVTLFWDRKQTFLYMQELPPYGYVSQMAVSRKFEVAEQQITVAKVRRRWRFWLGLGAAVAAGLYLVAQ